MDTTSGPTSTKVWMPLFIGDYLADTSRLTTEQHGAYLLLIFDYWRNGPLPNDDAVLLQVTKLRPDAWSMSQVLLRGLFRLGEDGLLHHKRIDAELAKSKQNRETAAEKAKKAANARWAKNAPRNAPSMPEALLEECASPSPSQKDSFESYREAWNELRGSLPEVTRLTDGRIKKLRTRISEGLTLDSFKSVVRICASTPFLRGDPNGAKWKVSFSWLIENDLHMVEIVEGKYGPAEVPGAMTSGYLSGDAYSSQDYEPGGVQ